MLMSMLRSMLMYRLISMMMWTADNTLFCYNGNTRNTIYKLWDLCKTQWRKRWTTLGNLYRVSLKRLHGYIRVPTWLTMRDLSDNLWLSKNSIYTEGGTEQLSSTCLCRASVHFFHRLSILERATDHECNINCNRLENVCVRFKCNGLIVFSQRGGYSKVCNICCPPPPHPSPHLLSLVPPSPAPPPAPLLLGGTISGSGALTGVFS